MIDLSLAMVQRRAAGILCLLRTLTVLGLRNCGSQPRLNPSSARELHATSVHCKVGPAAGVLKAFLRGFMQSQVERNTLRKDLFPRPGALTTSRS